MRKGQKMTEEQRLVRSLISKRMWAEGRGSVAGIHSKAARAKASVKASATRMGHKHTPTGERHFAWKGDAVGYSSLHEWIARQMSKTGACVKCGRTDKKTDWANVSGEYRRDVADFFELCRPCHRHHDFGLARAREMH